VISIAVRDRGNHTAEILKSDLWKRRGVGETGKTYSRPWKVGRFDRKASRRGDEAVGARTPDADQGGSKMKNLNTFSNSNGGEGSYVKGGKTTGHVNVKGKGNSRSESYKT